MVIFSNYNIIHGQLKCSVDLSNCGMVFISILKLMFIECMPANSYDPMHYSHIIVGYSNHHLSPHVAKSISKDRECILAEPVNHRISQTCITIDSGICMGRLHNSNTYNIYYHSTSLIYHTNNYQGHLWSFSSHACILLFS